MKKTDGFESTRDVEEEIKRLLEKEDKSKIKFGKGKRKVEAEGNAATILAGSLGAAFLMFVGAVLFGRKDE